MFFNPRIVLGDVVMDITEEQVADLRRQLDSPAIVDPGMIDAVEVARRLGVGRDWVYAHAEQLGGEKVGAGPKPRWRFDPTTIRQRKDDPPVEKPALKRRARRQRAGGGHRLQVRGETPYAS